MQSKELISEAHEVDVDIFCISYKNLGYRGNWSHVQSRHFQSRKHPRFLLAEYLDRTESDGGAARHESSAPLVEQTDLQRDFS